MMSPKSPHWLYEWLDENGLRTLSDADSALQRTLEFEDLCRRADSAIPKLSDRTGGVAVLAGRGFDLSGQFDCPGSICRQVHVDQLFGKVWHYFDKIVAADAVTRFVIDETVPVEDRKRRVLEYVDTLLYVRSLGAEHLLEFREKHSFEKKDWKRAAEQAGLDYLVGSSRSIIARLIAQSTFQVVQTSTALEVHMSHPGYDRVLQWNFPLKNARKLSTYDLRYIVAAEYFERHVTELATDVVASRETMLPLAPGIGLHGKLLAKKETSSDAEIALTLKLPILEHIDVKSLIKLRNDEQPSFERFRNRLRQAMKERLKCNSATNAEQLGQEIVADIVGPELRTIQEKLRTASVMLSKKTAVGVALGSLVTGCGVMVGFPAPAAFVAGSAAVATIAGAAAAKQVEEQREVELSDMYFLWQAAKHNHEPGIF